MYLKSCDPLEMSPVLGYQHEIVLERSGSDKGVIVANYEPAISEIATYNAEAAGNRLRDREHSDATKKGAKDAHGCSRISSMVDTFIDLAIRHCANA